MLFQMYQTTHKKSRCLCFRHETLSRSKLYNLFILIVLHFPTNIFLIMSPATKKRAVSRIYPLRVLPSLIMNIRSMHTSHIAFWNKLNIIPKFSQKHHCSIFVFFQHNSIRDNLTFFLHLGMITRHSCCFNP